MTDPRRMPARRTALASLALVAGLAGAAHGLLPAPAADSSSATVGSATLGKQPHATTPGSATLGSATLGKQPHATTPGSATLGSATLGKHTHRTPGSATLG